MYAQQMIDEYRDAGIKPSRVWAQSFDLADVEVGMLNSTLRVIVSGVFRNSTPRVKVNEGHHEVWKRDSPEILGIVQIRWNRK